MKRMTEMMVKLTAFAVAVMLLNVNASMQADDCVLTNVYSKAMAIFSSTCGNADEANTRFAGVRGGGFLIELEGSEWQAFSNLCAVVSNQYPTILGNWGKYCTNELVRFSVLNAVAFSGECVYTNFLDRLMANSTGSGTTDVSSVEYLYSPFGTPMEEFLAMRYDMPSISNLLVRVSNLAERTGNTNLVRSCSQRISGAVKQYLLENR